MRRAKGEIIDSFIPVAIKTLLMDTIIEIIKMVGSSSVMA